MYSLRMSFWIVPVSAAAGDALLLADELVEQQQQRGGGVDGHRRRDLVERDAVEEHAHVVDRVDRDADLADLAVRDRIVGVVTHLGRQVEGDRQPGRAVRDQLVVAPVRLARGAEARRTAGSSTAGRCTSRGRRPWCTETHPAPRAGRRGPSRRGSRPNRRPRSETRIHSAPPNASKPQSVRPKGANVSGVWQRPIFARYLGL